MCISFAPSINGANKSIANNFFANLAFRPGPGQPNTATNTTSAAAATMTLAFRPAPGTGPPTNTNTTAVAARDLAAAVANPAAEGACGPMTQGEEDENEDDEEREETEGEEMDALLGSLERDFQAKERLRREQEEEAAARSGQEEEAPFRSSSSQVQIREGIAHRREHWRSLGRDEQRALAAARRQRKAVHRWGAHRPRRQ